MMDIETQRLFRARRKAHEAANVEWLNGHFSAVGRCHRCGGGPKHHMRNWAAGRPYPDCMFPPASDGTYHEYVRVALVKVPA